MAPTQSVVEHKPIQQKHYRQKYRKLNGIKQHNWFCLKGWATHINNKKFYFSHTYPNKIMQVKD